MIAERSLYYVLDGHTPVPVESVIEWGQFFQDSEKRRVALATWRDTQGEEIANVSTVFLGLDHAWGQTTPELFETMVFTSDLWPNLSEDDLNEWCERCATWDEAEAQHKRACELVRAAFGEVT